MLDHAGQSLEELWHEADASKDGGFPERHLPRAALGSQMDGTPELPSWKAGSTGDRVLAPHSPLGAGTCLQPHLQSEAGNALGPYCGIAIASLEKKEVVNYGHEPSFHLLASS